MQSTDHLSRSASLPCLRDIDLSHAQGMGRRVASIANIDYVECPQTMEAGVSSSPSLAPDNLIPSVQPLTAEAQAASSLPQRAESAELPELKLSDLIDNEGYIQYEQTADELNRVAYLCREQSAALSPKNPDNYHLEKTRSMIGRRRERLKLQPYRQMQIEAITKQVKKETIELVDRIKTEGGFSIEKHTKGCVETMADGAQAQAELMTKLDDTAYGRKNLRAFRAVENNTEVFAAKYQGDLQILFSNRGARHELRDQNLRMHLERENYTCLRDFIRKLHLTKYDQQLIGIAGFLLAKVNSYAHDFSLDDDLKNQILAQLADFKICKIPMRSLTPSAFEFMK